MRDVADTDDGYIRLSDAARLFGMNERTLRYAVRRGRIKAERHPGRGLVTRREWVEAYFADAPDAWQLRRRRQPRLDRIIVDVLNAGGTIADAARASGMTPGAVRRRLAHPRFPRHLLTRPIPVD